MDWNLMVPGAVIISYQINILKKASFVEFYKTFSDELFEWQFFYCYLLLLCKVNNMYILLFLIVIIVQGKQYIIWLLVVIIY
jgi:hypothetical protein